jgi:hypothetical protein
MAETDYTEERMLRFHALYAAVTREKFDRSEFEADDLYAFQALERALRSENQELRNIAAHLQAQRQTEMEAITLKSSESLLESTRKMTVLPADPVAVTAPEPSILVEPVAPERPAGQDRLSPVEVGLVSNLQRLYSKQFGRAFEIKKFITDEKYGRSVLDQSLAAPDPALVDVAKRYQDERGRRQLNRGAATRQEAPAGG